MYIPKISDYLKILTDASESERFCSHKFDKYFNSMKEQLYSKLNEEQNLRKVAELLYIFLIRPDEVAKIC